MNNNGKQRRYQNGNNNSNNNGNNGNNGNMGRYVEDDDDGTPVPNGSHDNENGEFDENDKKIISLYEIINELIEECKYRTQDLLFLQQSGDSEATDPVASMEKIEERNDISLQQIFQELQLKEKKTEDDDEDDEEDEDETDQGWEIYNTVVKNLNDYMELFADSMHKIKDLKQQLNNLENPTETDVTELELVIEEQTTALEETIRKNDELEKALANVLTEYSNKINMSNDETATLHAKLSQQNTEHQQQLRELRAMYETKINELQSNNEDEYKEEVRKLLDTLVSSRGDFRVQIDSLTNEMSQTQRIHHRKIMKLMSEKQALEDDTTKWQTLYRDIKEERESVLDKVIDSLDCIRGELDIDDEEEYFYLKKSTRSSQDRQARSKQRSYHKDRSQNNSNFDRSSYGNYSTNGSTSNVHKGNGASNNLDYAQYHRDDNANSSTNRSHSQRSHNSGKQHSNRNDKYYSSNANGHRRDKSSPGSGDGSGGHHHSRGNSSSKKSKKGRSASPGRGGSSHGSSHGSSSRTSSHNNNANDQYYNGSGNNYSSNSHHSSKNHRNDNYNPSMSRNQGNGNNEQVPSNYQSRRVKGHNQGSSLMSKGKSQKKPRSAVAPENGFD